MTTTKLFRGGWKRSRSLFMPLTLLAATLEAGLAQTSYQRLKSFGRPELSGAEPHAALVEGSGGVWYGTTELGGAANLGTIFHINADGSGYQVLHSFGPAPDAAWPYGRLVAGGDGAVYGTTVFGGSNGLGTVFKVGTNGSGYAVLHHFSTNRWDGENPYGGLLVGGDGALYAATAGGGTNGVGTVFKLSTDGTGYTLLHSFSTNGSDGRFPGELIQGLDGALYGMTRRGGVSNAGTMFTLGTDGGSYAVLRSFDAPAGDGGSHHAGLMQGSDGTLYGTMYSGGTNTLGAVFKLTTNGSDYAVLHKFTASGFDGQNPDGRLVQGADGTLFATTVKGGTNGYGTLFQISTNGTGYTVLRSFGSAAGDGQCPSDTLALGSDGALRGTTLFGGAHNEGTVFRISPDGSGYSVLRSFASSGDDGQTPRGRLIRGSDGGLYGTTASGGSAGAGTVFKLTLNDSNCTVLHDFGSTTADGQRPLGGLLEALDGALYGTTSEGGDNGVGTVFKLTRDGSSYLVLHSFSAAPDANLPSGTLTQGPDGKLYGVSGGGGSNDVGTVFGLDTNGGSYSVLHHFSTNGTGGWGPVGGLALGRDGVLYGTTADGGSNTCGTVFRMGTDGSGYTVLRTFRTNNVDGRTPYAGLIQGVDGAFYGTTRFGGSTNAGTLFRLNSDGSGYAVIHAFGLSGSDGQEPFGELSQGTDGMWYGTTCYGGAFATPTNDSDMGTVFWCSPDGANYRTVQSFGATGNNGRNPSAGLYQGPDGFLYGTAELGGDLNSGTVYALGLAPVLIGQPQDRVVLLGGTAVFNVTAVGGALNYHWLFNGAPLADAIGPDLTLAGVVRTNAGTYAVQVTNTVGSVLSSNGTLTVQVPQLLSTPVVMPTHSLELTSAYVDGWPLQPSDLSRFDAQVSSNLLNWKTLSNALTWSAGLLLLNDPGSSNQPARFYRVIEH
jgi:uncharacterized repeat protein (TIGR03803 family)